jgi:pimeloyl-ACP methyl ester carboxylesterase
MNQAESSTVTGIKLGAAPSVASRAHQPDVANPFQRFLFTLVITCVSRFLFLRDLLAGKLALDLSAHPHASRHSIASGASLLDAMLVRPPSSEPRAVLLICHGIGEVVERWMAVQQLLAEDGVASLVFDYSGYGRSSGRVSARQCERDAIAAFTYLQTIFPAAEVSILGFSMGTGVCGAILDRVAAQRLVLCAGFTSFRAAARRTGIPKALNWIVPPIWSTESALSRCAIPVRIVHGEQDWLFPVEMARTLERACASPCELVVVPGLSHDEPYYQPERWYWRAVADFVTSR